MTWPVCEAWSPSFSPASAGVQTQERVFAVLSVFLIRSLRVLTQGLLCVKGACRAVQRESVSVERAVLGETETLPEQGPAGARPLFVE